MRFLTKIFSRRNSKKDSKISEVYATELETYFQQFKKHIVGEKQTFQSPYGEKKIIYTDWTASGRLYRPIEEKLLNEFVESAFNASAPKTALTSKPKST